jgi:DNA-binding IclR family transcriptional regulator
MRRDSSRDKGDEADDGKGVVIALARGLSILQCFTAERTELGPTDIAALLGLPQPTVWRLCQTLQKLGFLVPAVTHDKLSVGEAVLRLGHAAASSTSLVDYALPLMREVSSRFGVSVSLGSRFGADMLIVQRASGPSILQLNMHVGSTLGVLGSSLGWAYLCGLPAAERRTVLEEVRAERPANFATSLKAFRKAYESYESDGFIIALGQTHPLINAIGVPVVSPDGRRVMSVNGGSVSLVCTPEYLRGDLSIAMKNLASRLGARLGSVPEGNYATR